MTIVAGSENKEPPCSNPEGKEETNIIRQTFLKALYSLVFTLEAKNKYTSGHSQRVTKVAVAMARELKMPKQYIEQIRIAGLLHDVGKVGVDDTILNKQEQLTEEEFRHIASHSTLGERILRPIIDEQEILKTVKHHHEQYDGTGYPDGLKARYIPVGARILAVADAYDAMTSNRPHRKAMTSLLTVIELKARSGTQFDPIAVNALILAQSRLAKSKNPKQAIVNYT
ncbi:HD-GYP domain-containing protein [Chloroflexota bacterium]